MSYVIVYDKIFIKTTRGTTLAVLHGDNNVWEPVRNRRSRDWHCWALENSDDELMQLCQELHSSYDQVFKCNGKWVDNAGLDKWFKNGMKNARTIEDILSAKPGLSFHCYLSLYNDDIPYGEEGYYRKEFSEYIHTTEEFEKWVDKAKAREANKADKEYICVVTAFSNDEPLRLGRVNKINHLSGKRVIAKYKNTMYVTKCADGRFKSACSDIKQALIFNSIEEAQLACGKSSVTFIDADKALAHNAAKNCCIKAIKNNQPTLYVTKVTKSGFRYTYNRECARKYTEAEAKSQIERMKPRFASYTFFVDKDVTG